MKKYCIWMIVVMLLAACNPSGVVPLSEGESSPTAVDLLSKGESSASTGPEGVTKVEISDGVILLTPGQSYDPASMNGGITNVAGFATPTPAPTMDPTLVEMPEGIPLYPGATNLKVPTAEELTLMKDMTGLSGYYVIFYTTDSNDQVVRFYTEKAAAAGWSVTDTQTEPDYDGSITQMWSNENTLLLLQTWQPVDGLMKVAITWM